MMQLGWGAYVSVGERAGDDFGPPRPSPPPSPLREEESPVFFPLTNTDLSVKITVLSKGEAL